MSLSEYHIQSLKCYFIIVHFLGLVKDKKKKKKTYIYGLSAFALVCIHCGGN